MEHDLVLDPNIRDWVFLPLIAIMFLIGILRHNVTFLLKSEPKPGEKEQAKQTMALMRSRRLRANSRFLSPSAFHARRQYFRCDPKRHVPGGLARGAAKGVGSPVSLRAGWGCGSH
ncbi:hypothetical protein T492DRAFT_1152472 [Pavlovales sp. CCMP2436]|nr:hypothetical protein T492DRAFT_1152472 [Pavlovales sp. CCMP2436]